MTRWLFVFFAFMLDCMVGSILHAAGRTAACEPEASLALRLVNDARADPDTLDYARREAAAIWATAGVRLVWTAQDAADAAGAAAEVAAYIIVRRALGGPDARAAAARRPGRSVMGRVLIAEDGRPTPLIHVSLDATAFSVLNGRQPSWQDATMPIVLQRYLVGRALGRVIAHEIGHWLRGPGHAREGLMKPILYPRDLRAHEPPALPASWRPRTEVASEALRCVR